MITTEQIAELRQAAERMRRNHGYYFYEDNDEWEDYWDDRQLILDALPELIKAWEERECKSKTGSDPYAYIQSLTDDAFTDLVKAAENIPALSPASPRPGT